MFSKNLNIASDEFQELQLFRSENVGAITYNSLIKSYGSAKVALENLEMLATNGGLKRKINIASEESITEEIEKSLALNANFIFKSSPFYPQALLQVEDAPPVFTAIGDISILQSEKVIGIVGARNCSINGGNLAKLFATKLGESGYKISSGLALGIDTYAHTGSLASGTVAVLAGGVDVIYPSKNTGLYHSIMEKGAIISEKPLGTVPIAQYFPQRNRIISGIAKALIIIEASLKSGSLITAKFALKQNKKIFAVPGSPLDERSKGCNDLIRNQHAVLLDNYEQVISYLQNNNSFVSDINSSRYQEKTHYSPPTSTELSKHRATLESAISFEETNIESIIVCTKIPMHILNVLLLELELAGKIQRLYGNKIIRIDI